jgi:hypothetical protein
VRNKHALHCLAAKWLKACLHCAASCVAEHHLYMQAYQSALHSQRKASHISSVRPHAFVAVGLTHTLPSAAAEATAMQSALPLPPIQASPLIAPLCGASITVHTGSSTPPVSAKPFQMLTLALSPEVAAAASSASVGCQSIRTNLCVCVCVCVFVCVSVCVCVRERERARERERVREKVCVYQYVYISMYIYLHI